MAKRNDRHVVKEKGLTKNRLCGKHGALFFASTKGAIL